MELIDVLETAAIVLSLTYVVLAAKENMWCWPPAFVASALFAYITFQRDILGESFIQTFYVLMAVYGYWQWQRPVSGTGVLPIKEWTARAHIIAITCGLLLSLAVGAGLEHLFGSALPYVDAITTVFSLLATFMVARKVLSNWLYWIAIDLLNVYLYWNRNLELTSGLYLLYAVLAVWGYIRWRETWKGQRV